MTKQQRDVVNSIVKGVYPYADEGLVDGLRRVACDLAASRLRRDRVPAGDEGAIKYYDLAARQVSQMLSDLYDQ